MAFTRRDFCRTCTALVFGRRFLRAEEQGPLTWASQVETGGGLQYRYRADAQIILLSIPVLHRKGVGDGAAVWRDSITADGMAERFLEFTGRSAPEHAAGLNRFGFIQELSRTMDSGKLESLYFGLMTSSPEENAADARKALHSNAKDAWFSAIEGRIAAGRIETVSTRFVAPAQTAPADRNQLIERARLALAKTRWQSRPAAPADSAPRPFLHVLAGVLSAPGTVQTQYVYNGRVYQLRVEKSPDSKAANTFRGLGLIPATAAVTRISGKLWREDGGKPSEFRLWIEEGNPRPLPLRIEYQAKTYLRLTFEAQA
jgi:hypothetical protein